MKLKTSRIFPTKIALLIHFILVTTNLISQRNFDLILQSEILSEGRKVSIQLPASYERETEKTYPVVYALDGEYTQFVLNGTVDFYSFFDKIPECIVVSIYQNYEDTASKKYQRWLDCDYDYKNGMPEGKGILFKEFITNELIPFVDSSYRTTAFRTIVGHSFTANYINYFLLDEKPVFSGYIAITPYFADNSLDLIRNAVAELKMPVFYFVSCGEKDLSGHIQSVKRFDATFSKLTNENFNYARFESTNNQATHYTILPVSIPAAIEHVFSLYSPISSKEFQKILKIENQYGYLIKRYKDLEALYGMKVEIREDDLNLMSYAISKSKNWSQLKDVGELAIALYPNSFTGYWILGELEEKKKNYPAALKHYETGYATLGDDVLNKADFQADIDRVKKKL